MATKMFSYIFVWMLYGFWFDIYTYGPFQVNSYVWCKMWVNIIFFNIWM